MSILLHTIVTLPKNDDLSNELLNLLSNCGTRDKNSFEITSSDNNYVPRQSFVFAEVEHPTISFVLDDRQIIKQITNSTGEEKLSPHSYQQLFIGDIASRIDTLGSITKIDHLGVNFPWFNGISPILLELREQLKATAAYYLFPDGQPWDFILPATKGELESGSVDLSIERRPKLELVSFEKASRPLIQIDCVTTASYNELKNSFPEGIHSDELSNVWVYIKTTMPVDLCLVLNQKTNGDWSSFFAGHRLSPR